MYPDETQGEAGGSASEGNANSGGSSGQEGGRFDLGDFKHRPDAKPAPRSNSPRGGGYAPRGRGESGGGYRGDSRNGERGSYSGGRGGYSGGRGDGRGGYADRGGRGDSRGDRKEFRPHYGGSDDSSRPARPRDGGRTPDDRGGYAGPRSSDRGGYAGPRSSDRGGYSSDRGGYQRDRGGSGYGDKPSYGGRSEGRGGYGDRGSERGPRPSYGSDRGRGGYNDRFSKPNRESAPGAQPAFSGVHRISDEFAGDDKGFTPKASPEIRLWLQLKTDKGRYRHSRFILEGSKAIQELLALDPGILVEAYVGPSFKDEGIIAALKKARISVHTVLDTDIGLLSDTETPQGIVAIANFAALKPNWTTAHAVTLLDGIQDPGNIGAIFRTSLALGMDAVLLGKGCCDPYNGKVLRSSVGALMRTPFETDVDLASQLNFLRQKGFSIVATSSHAPATLEQVNLKRKVALVVGNEGSGSGANLLDLADAVVKIPLRKSVESLNVSVAHGILCHELMKSRGAQLH
jgi:tRNA G18 (ribose-2'-O)-methylase SpoU